MKNTADFRQNRKLDSANLFGRWYDGKAYFPLLLRRKNNKLTFRQHLVFSFLTFRRAVQGGTKEDICKATGMHRVSVGKSISELISMRLVENEGKRLLAADPSCEYQDWFVWRPGEKYSGRPWYRRLMSFRCLHTPKKWTPYQIAFYCCLLSDNMNVGMRLKPSQKRTGLAKMLGVSVDTIQRSYKKLESFGLIEQCYLRRPKEGVLKFFPDKSKPNTKSKWLLSMALGWPFAEWRDGPALAAKLDKYAIAMSKGGKYSRNEIVNFFLHVRDQCEGSNVILFRYLDSFPTVWKEVEAIHMQNQADGRYRHLKNSCRLLEADAAERIGRMKSSGQQFIPNAPFLGK